MPASAAKLESQELQMDGGLEGLMRYNRVHQFRREIGIVADQAYREKFISDEAHEGLNEVVHGQDKLPTDDRKLEKVLDFQRKDYAKAERVLARLSDVINQAILEKAASDTDRRFLMDNRILTGKHNLTEEAERLEVYVKEKMKSRRRDRKIYDSIAQHPLVRNTGFLKVDQHTKIGIPNEEAFLKMTPEERQKLLKRAVEAIPQAEAYAKTIDSAESADLAKQYDQLLDTAQNKRKIIGANTAKKFKDGFGKIDRKEKENWVNEFENQMERYEKLWGDIRNTLSGNDLEHMESRRDQMGWSELSKEFGDVLCGSYDRQLNGLRTEKIISRHTRDTFAKDMKKQSLSEQQRYYGELKSQMERYRTLRGNIDKLKNKKAQTELNAMYSQSECGYTEINRRYLELTCQTEAEDKHSGQPDKMQSILSLVRRDRVRKGIKEGEELMENDEHKKKMIHRLDRLVLQEEESRYDASNYVKNVQDVRRKQQKKESRKEMPVVSSNNPANQKPSLIARLFGRKETPEKRGGVATESQSIASLRAQNRQLEESAGEGIHTVTKADDRFGMTRIKAGSEEVKVIQFEIGKKEAAAAFLHEDVNIERDHLRLVARDGQAEQMTLKEIRYYRDYLKESMNPANDNAVKTEKI